VNRQDLTRDGNNWTEICSGGSTKKGESDGAWVRGARLPNNLIPRSGGDRLTRRGSGDEVETAGLGSNEDRGCQRKDSGKGETHLCCFLLLRTGFSERSA